MSEVGPEKGQLVAIFEEPSTFRANVSEALQRLGHRVEHAGTWEQAEDLMGQRGDEITVGVMAPQLPGAPEGSFLDALREHFESRFPIFSATHGLPTHQQALHLRSRGGCGFLERTASTREIAFRIDALLRGLDPSTFVAAPRVELNVPLTYIVDAREQAEWRAGLLCNLSRTGLFVSTRAMPEEGREIELRFNLEEKADGVRCRGRVVRQQHNGTSPYPPGIGVAFENLPYVEERRFSDFVMGRLGAPAQLMC